MSISGSVFFLEFRQTVYHTQGFELNRIFRLQEHIPNCCLPQALGGDVPESNAYDFYEFCKENAHIVEQKYRYLKSWSKKEEPHPFFM